MAINRKHIDKVFDQRFSLSDQKMLEKYFEDNDLNEETKQVVKEQWNQFDSGKSAPPNLDHVFYKLYYSINNVAVPASKNINHYFRWTQIAAILVVGVLIAASLYITRHNYSSIVGQQVEFISNTGFRNQFKLPDGTSGWLGEGTEMKYHLDENHRRVVDLNGLAYFNVVHNSEQPFVVKTPKNLAIEVLGTKFNVSAYKSDPVCEVVLEKGSVMLTNNKGIIEKMTPNDRIVFHSDFNQIEKSQVNTADFLAWIEGKLVMNDISFKEACQKIGLFYHVDIDLRATNVENEKVRLVLENESLDDALKLLSVIASVNFQVQKRELLADGNYSKKKIIIINK